MGQGQIYVSKHVSGQTKLTPNSYGHSSPSPLFFSPRDLGSCASVDESDISALLERDHGRNKETVQSGRPERINI